MRKTEIKLGEDRVVFYNPELDRNFTVGIYQREDGCYEETAPYRFQLGIPGTTIKNGNLRDRPYFICRGRDIPRGSKKLEGVIIEANTQGRVSVDELKTRVKLALPSAEIYGSYEEFRAATFKADRDEIFRIAGIKQ